MWRHIFIYGLATPFPRHFHVVFDVASCLLNLSNDESKQNSQESTTSTTVTLNSPVTPQISASSEPPDSEVSDVTTTNSNSEYQELLKKHP